MSINKVPDWVLTTMAIAMAMSLFAVSCETIKGKPTTENRCLNGYIHTVYLGKNYSVITDEKCVEIK